MRVAYLLEQCWHRVPGGTATSALGVARALSERGDVELTGISAWHRRPPPEPFRPPIRVAAVPLPRRALYESWHALRLPRVEWTTRSVDVVHATGMAIPATRAPLVVTVHDLEFLRTPNLASRHGQRFFERSWALTLRDAALVLCPSEATKRDCAARGFDEQRIEVVPWGVAPVAVAERAGAEVRRRYGITEPYVLTVGTIEPRKNLGALAEAMRRLDHAGVQLVVVGPAGWNTDARTLFGRLGERVRLTGFVDERELWALYSSASVYCHPALAEGFGIPVLEAMAAGTPVVVGRATATEEVAGSAGLAVDTSDPAALADALDRILADEKLATDLRRWGTERAATFTWARAAELTVGAYRRAAA